MADVDIERLTHDRFDNTNFTAAPAPKVGSVSLSPRGDWRMPSDAEAKEWLERLDKLSNGSKP